MIFDTYLGAALALRTGPSLGCLDLIGAYCGPLRYSSQIAW